MRYYLSITILICLVSCNQKQESTKPVLTTINEAVYATVSLAPADLYYPSISKAGIIKMIYVSEGDSISKGQLLFEVDASSLEKRITAARIDEDQAKEDYSGPTNLLNNIKTEMELQQQALQLDSINYLRQQRLWNQNIGSKTALEKAKLNYDASVNKYLLLQKKYDQTEKSLLTKVEKTINQLQEQQHIATEYKVFSKIDGRIYSILKQEGEMISTQERFGEIGSKDDFIILMDIDEVDIAKINLTDTALITLDAYPAKIFTATITTIAPKKDQSTQTFRVECAFTTTPPKLYSGLSGEANIVIASRSNILTIPTDYLLDNSEVLTPNGKQAVVVGLKNLEFVEILSGIDTATTLLKPDR